MWFKLLSLSLLQKPASTRKLCTIPKRSTPLNVSTCSDLIAYLNKETKPEIPRENASSPCIYRVPRNMLLVEPGAYVPNIISIGPYHYGSKHLNAMEDLKLQFCNRLFSSKNGDGLRVEKVIEAMQNSGAVAEARRCYKDAFDPDEDKFLKVMVVDGCFIIELLKQLNQDDVNLKYRNLSHWMISLFRRDLIMLENQLPFFILETILETICKYRPDYLASEQSLEELALWFFNPLIGRSPEISEQNNSNKHGKALHFLDLFRSSILPKKMSWGKESRTIYEATELQEAGVMFQGRRTFRSLDVSLVGRLLTIPTLHIDDYRGTLFRNMVAFEQCHNNCKPDVTSYLFFLDGLINSKEDVDLLHYKGVLNHSLGSDKDLARLVNRLLKEVPRDAEQSYLFEVVNGVCTYCNKECAKLRAMLVRHYFSNWVVGVATPAAAFSLYLSVIQTGSGVVSAAKELDPEDHFITIITDSIFLPILGRLGFGKSSRQRSACSEDCWEWWWVVAE